MFLYDESLKEHVLRGLFGTLHTLITPIRFLSAFNDLRLHLHFNQFWYDTKGYFFFFTYLSILIYTSLFFCIYFFNVILLI